MPELPEVEVVRRGLSDWVAGRAVEEVRVLDERSLRRYAPGASAFTELLTASRFLDPQRRGKYLWIPFIEKSAQVDVARQALVIHLGMSGQVLVKDTHESAHKHLRISFRLAGDEPQAIHFVDQRIFGGMQISPLIASTHSSGSVPAVIAHIAEDPLEPQLTPEEFFQALKSKRTELKRALLDQTVVSGIGNIYADEALWGSQLHYSRRSDTITRAQARILFSCVQQVMALALQAGGTSFDSLYVNVNGNSGYFDRSLNCYGQEGRYCSRCLDSGYESKILRSKFMNRSSFWCPTCQRQPRGRTIS